MKELDRRLAFLGRSEIDHDLRGLENDVWKRIDARCLAPMPSRMATALCAGLAVLASLGGAITATAAAHTPSPAPVFAIHAAWTPSTMLGD